MKYFKKAILILLAICTLSIGVACTNDSSKKDGSNQTSNNTNGDLPGIKEDGEFGGDWL